MHAYRHTNGTQYATIDGVRYRNVTVPNRRADKRFEDNNATHDALEQWILSDSEADKITGKSKEPIKNAYSRW